VENSGGSRGGKSLKLDRAHPGTAQGAEEIFTPILDLNGAGGSEGEGRSEPEKKKRVVLASDKLKLENRAALAVDEATWNNSQLVNSTERPEGQDLDRKTKKNIEIGRKKGEDSSFGKFIGITMERGHSHS